MKTLSAPTLAALASGSVAIVTLLALEFSGTPIYLNTSTWNLVFGGKTYLGAAGLGTIGVVTDKPGEISGINLELDAGSSTVVALALDDADVVQGTVCTLRTAIIETVNYTILDAPVEWVGSLDTMGLAEDGTSASISVTAESKAVDLLRGTPWLYTDEDQVLVNATDHSFSFVVDQIDKPIVWPAREYFHQ